MFDLYAQGLSLVMKPDVLLWLVAGSVIGILIGALPGLTVTMGVAILTPLTFQMSTEAAFALLLGAYAGGTYGGSISAILLKIPGALPSVMTTLDGFPMGQRGEAGRAIGLATVSSLIGGIVSAVILAVMAPPLAALAIEFSAPEYLAVALFALSVIAYVSQESLLRGIFSGALGLLVATIGADPNVGFPRFTAGLTELISGVELVPIMIGLFGLTEVLSNLERPISEMVVIKRIGRILPSMAELKRLAPTFLRSSAIGVGIGILPAAGSSMAAIVAYGVEKRTSRHSEKFGTGIPEGIAAPETSNNACTGGDMVPTLSLGIPGSTSTAILMGALILHGLQPGPTLFSEHGEVASAIFILLLLSNLVFFVLGILGARYFAKALEVPPPYMLPAITMLCVIGAYAIRNSTFDVAVMLAAGIAGMVMRKTKIPTAPLILGLILGPMIESNLQRMLLLFHGGVSQLFTRPISLSFVVITLVFLFSPWVAKKLASKQELAQVAAEE